MLRGGVRPQLAVRGRPESRSGHVVTETPSWAWERHSSEAALAHLLAFPLGGAFRTPNLAELLWRPLDCRFMAEVV